MLTLIFRDTAPIYGQIRDGLRRMIVTGAISADEKLPSVRSLAMDLAINPNTIQRAYGELEREGFIYSIPGKGSFAAPGQEGSDPRREELLQKFRELLAELRYLHVTDRELMAIMEEGKGA